MDIAASETINETRQYWTVDIPSLVSPLQSNLCTPSLLMLSACPMHISDVAG